MIREMVSICGNCALSFAARSGKEKIPRLCAHTMINIILGFGQQIDVAIPREEPIVTVFITDEEHDQQGGRKPQRETEQIDCRMSPIA